MAKIDLAQYGIKDVKEVIYNPSYEELSKLRLTLRSKASRKAQ